MAASSRFSLRASSKVDTGAARPRRWLTPRWSRRNLEPGRRDPVLRPGDPVRFQSCFGGGAVRPVTTFDAAQEILTHWPQFLPDGRHFYYQRSAKAEHQGTYVTALDSSQSTRVLETGQGRLRLGTPVVRARRHLFARRSMTVRTRTGEPIRVADGRLLAGALLIRPGASSSGVLAHGPSVVFTTSLARSPGATIGPPTPARAYGSPRLSPDQTSVLVAITDATTAQPDLWLLAPARGTTHA